MLKRLFSKNQRNKDEQIKKIILKTFFSFSNQKKAIERAARESAKDQKDLMEKYSKYKLAGMDRS